MRAKLHQKHAFPLEAYSFNVENSYECAIDEGRGKTQPHLFDLILYSYYHLPQY